MEVGLPERDLQDVVLHVYGDLRAKHNDMMRLYQEHMVRRTPDPDRDMYSYMFDPVTNRVVVHRNRREAVTRVLRDNHAADALSYMRDSALSPYEQDSVLPVDRWKK